MNTHGDRTPAAEPGIPGGDTVTWYPDPKPTSRLVLRRLRPGDLPVLHAMNRDPRVMEYLGGVMTETQTRDLLKRIQAHFHDHREYFITSSDYNV